jgi:hypothetical protein
MEVAHAESEVGHSEINDPVKLPRAFMTAALGLPHRQNEDLATCEPRHVADESSDCQCHLHPEGHEANP